MGEYFRQVDVRIVNMSWRDDQSEFEDWLAKTSTEKEPTSRKRLAAQMYAVRREAVEGRSAMHPEPSSLCGG